MIGGLLLNRRNSLGVLICALFAGPFCAGVKAQAVQPQTGSSTGQTQPTQAQGQQGQNQPSADEAKKKQDQKKQDQKKQTQAKQKKVKAHVVNLDKKKKPEADTAQSAEPDKILYERALFDIKKSRFTEGRLTLQSLINTYPDSEYLAKAKLAVADSYFKEGGTSNLTQAVDEYKNFIIFFPFLDEAAYAQMQIGMGHLRMMEKPDRDTTQGQEAEQEFQTFLLKYPQNPLVPKAEQNLRNVQEVLADGEYRIARFYYLKQDYPASAARLIELTERYPLYSQSDEALWMLGDVYARAKRVSRNEDDKNHWSDLAGKCYARIAQNYPLSHLAPEARARLKAMGMAVPQTDPQAVARMNQEQLYRKQHHDNVVLHFPMAMLKSGPPFDAAARSGAPNLNPPNDVTSAKEVLLQGAKGPDFELAGKTPEDTGNQNSNEETKPVEAAQGSMSPQGTGVGVQIISPTDSGAPATSATPPAQPDSGSGSGSGAPPSSAASSDSGTGAPNSNTPSMPTSNPASIPGGSATTAAAQITTPAQDPPASTGGNQNGQTAASTSGGTNEQNPQTDAKKSAKADKADPGTESTSKKKKGIKKVIPW